MDVSRAARVNAMEILQVKFLNMKWLKKSQGKILRKFISAYLENFRI